MDRSQNRTALLATTGVGLLGALALTSRILRPRGNDSLRMPGDDLVPEATIVETHQTLIDALPAEAWPWLVQMGYGRGGFYSFDLLERLAGVDITSARSIESQWQDLAVGDRMHLSADVALTVARLEPRHYLVLSSDGGTVPPGAAMDFDFSWAFVLDEPDRRGSGRCRLRIRERYLPHRGTAAVVVRAARPVARLMTHGTMLGLRRRVRAADPQELMEP